MLTVTGHSDDIVFIDGDIQSEYDVYRLGKLDILVGCCEPQQGGNSHGVIITMMYGEGDKALWSAKVSQIDEDVLCPWEVTLTFAGYSPTVHINCPPNTPCFVFLHGKWVPVNGD
jgi:hypothetical protein